MVEQIIVRERSMHDWYHQPRDPREPRPVQYDEILSAISDIIDRIPNALDQRNEYRALSLAVISMPMARGQTTTNWQHQRTVMALNWYFMLAERYPATVKLNHQQPAPKGQHNFWERAVHSKNTTLKG